MSYRFVSRSLAIIGVVCGSWWCLAAVHAASQPQPADPGAKVPRTEYRSAFAHYRAFRDERLADWKSLNEDVERAGGHLGIMRATPAPIPPAPPKPAPDRRGATHHYRAINNSVTRLDPPLQGAPSLARLGRSTGADLGPRMPGLTPPALSQMERGASCAASVVTEFRKDPSGAP